MKKLLTLFSAIGIACAVQAASFTWGLSNIDSTDWNGAYIGEQVTATAYLFLGTVTASDTAFVFGDAVQLASGGQNADFTFGSLDSKIASSALTSDAAGQAFTIILVEDNGKSLSAYEGHYALLSGTSDHFVNPMDDTDTWAGFVSSNLVSAADWQTMPVPEPTSGLLMLLGMAGLALRRKQK